MLLFLDVDQRSILAFTDGYRICQFRKLSYDWSLFELHQAEVSTVENSPYLNVTDVRAFEKPSLGQELKVEVLSVDFLGRC